MTIQKVQKHLVIFQLFKNYLILHNNNNYKKLKTHDEMDVLDRHKI